MIILCGLQTSVQASAAPKAEDGITFKNDASYDASATGGVFLPYGVYGMTDSYRSWALAVSHPSSVTQMEYQLHSLIGHGVTRYSLTWTLRIDLFFSDVFAGFFGLGPTFNFTQFGDGPYNRSGGFHLTFGHFLPIASNLSFRSEIKYTNASGRSLYVGVGLIYAFGGKKEAAPPAP